MRKLVLCIIVAFQGLIAVNAQTEEFTVDGIQVILRHTPKEVVSAKLFIKGGTSNYSKEKEGIETFALNLAVSGGTASKDKYTFAGEAEQIGAEISAASTMDYGSINLTCVKMFWDKSWNLFADAIVNPAFDSEEFDLLKEQLISGAKQRESDPDQHLRQLSLQGAFPGKNYAKVPEGSTASLTGITLDEIKTYYKNTVGKQRVLLVVVGNITKEDLTAKINTSLVKLPLGTPAKVEAKTPLNTPSTISEDREMATNYIRGMMDAPKVDSDEGVAMALAMDIMRDRLFVELRTKRSLTYAPGAGYASSLVNSPYATLYASSTDPKQSIQVMVDEVNKLRTEGFSAKELLDKKQSFLTDYYMGLETTESIANQLGISEMQGGWESLDTFTKEVDGITIEQLNAAFKKYSNSIKWTYLGDKKLVTDDDFKQPQKTSKKKVKKSKS